MTLGEAIASALKIMGQYTLNGTLVPDNYNGQADTKNRMVLYADLAQKELARTAAKINHSFKVAHKAVPNLICSPAHEILQCAGRPVTMNGRGTPKAFYVEVDAPCVIAVSVNGIETVYEIEEKTEGFLPVKDVISSADGDTVCLILRGEHPFHYRNAALYDVPYQYAEDVPSFTTYFMPDVPCDLWQFKPGGVHFDGAAANAIESAQFRIENKTLFLNSARDGEWLIQYYARPQDISDNTPDVYEFEIPVMAHDAIPFKMAYLCALDGLNINPNVLSAMKNEYVQIVNSILPEPAYITSSIVNVY